jgi:pimeloyl-ACP methyl ester carboxylesterase
MWSRPVIVCEKHNLSINVTEWSRRGPPCVLIHGFADAGCVWSHLAIRLMSRLRVMAVDLRGHGNSDWDPEARYDSETFTADLARTVASFGLDRVILVGHSLGADVAIRYAAQNAERVAALVIIDFGPELTKAGVDEVVRAFLDSPRKFPSTEHYAQWLIERRPFADPGLLRQFARCSLRQSSAGDWELKADEALGAGSLLSGFELIDGRYRDPHLWLELERIRCPSLIIRGMGSGVFPSDVASRMVERSLSASRLANIAGAGHSVMMDNPVELTASVSDFLAGTAE